MRPSRRDILIATRMSSLAQEQALQVGRKLSELNPRVQLRLIPLESEGDRVLDHPLSALGGKGLFTRSIERCVLQKKADIAIHSFKDLPADQVTAGLVVAAVPRRLDAHDVLVCPTASKIEDLPGGARVGTCSRRRASQLLRVRPDLNISLLRGNVETRLRKVIEDRVFDATVLAAAGLKRLGLNPPGVHPIPLDQVLPAPGQAALAVQCRIDDHTSLRRCMPINHAASALACHLERRLVAALGADCHSPVAAHAQFTAPDVLRLQARVLSVDGRQCLEVDLTGPSADGESLLRQATADLIARGASALLAQARASAPAPAVTAPLHSV